MKIILAALVAFSAPAFAAGPALNDAQIAHIAYTAGVLDIGAAEQAIAKSADPQVKAFAETMLRDHRAVNEQALALVGRLGVTPEDNATSKALSGAAAETHARLARLEGPAFDEAYVANEVAFHATVNDALRSTLIPAASNAELRKLLESGHALFSQHQQHAEHLAAGTP